MKKVFSIIFLVSIFFSVGYLYGYNGYKTSLTKFPQVNISRELPPGRETLDFALFWRVWDTLYAKYFDQEKLIESKLVYGAIQGMVAAVGDPYTVFLPPSENKVVQEDLNGSFQGVGIQIGFKGNQLAVIAPLPDSPAENAGVKAGDLIIGIIDEQKEIERGTVGITLHEAVQIIRGPANSSVTLILTRDGEKEPLEIEIIRASINVPSIVVDYVGDPSASSTPEDGQAGQVHIAHVRLLKFSGETLAEWEDVVVELLKNPEISDVIVDVRNNPGGFLQGAVEVASDFLDIDEVVVVEDDGRGVSQEFRVEKLGRLRGMNVVVLINEGSASASEIFAGALRDNKKVQLIGQTTFGKGTIQEPQQINGGSGLHITIAKWLTPNGTWVNDGGLVPDVEVEDDFETEEDEQLQRAIEILND
ncbi:S41 family peptidase [Patescibacteria group bacterium]|nr:S41 family peptidase [Patescibacteria group bacterium]